MMISKERLNCLRVMDDKGQQRSNVELPSLLNFCIVPGIPFVSLSLSLSFILSYDYISKRKKYIYLRAIQKF